MRAADKLRNRPVRNVAGVGAHAAGVIERKSGVVVQVGGVPISKGIRPAKGTSPPTAHHSPLKSVVR